MDWKDYLSLTLCSIIPVILTILLYLLIKKWKWFRNRNYWIQQVSIGLIFSLITLGAFYFGVDYSSISSNNNLYADMKGNFGVANAIPVVSGLIFGGPAGFIAGLSGGIYRIFIYGFNNNDYLKNAEALSVFLAGGMTWIFRVWLFDNKKAKWFYGFAIGAFIEVIHMLLIYVNCFAQESILPTSGALYAFGIIRSCDIACFVTVSACIILSLVSIAIIERDKLIVNVRKDRRISTKIQKWFSFTFIITILFTFTFTYLGNANKYSYDVNYDLNNHLIDLTIQLKDLNITNIPEENINATYIKENNPNIYNFARFQRVNMDGFCLLLDGNSKKIMSVPSDISDDYIGKQFKISKENKGIDDYAENQTVIIPLWYENQNKYIDYAMKYKIYNQPNQYFYLLTIMSYEEAYTDMSMNVRLTSYLELLMFIVIFGIIYIFIKKVVVRNVYKINESLDKITNGNLNVKVEVRSNQEFSDLSDDINQTVDTLKKFIEEANKRIDKELEYAKKIQQNSLPLVFPTSNKYDLYASMHTAKEVGGDFYDYVVLDDSHVFFLIADVSGKGIPAAMFMMRAKTLVKSLEATNELTLDHVIENVNDELNEDNKTGMFVTAWFGIINTDTGVIEFVNAGHNPPVVRKNNKYHYLKMDRNCILGVMPNIKYKINTLKLGYNDEIILYTDGVTEATNSKKELFGEERFLKFLTENKQKSTLETLDDIYNELKRFQGNSEQADDITLLIVRYKNKKNKSIKKN